MKGIIVVCVVIAALVAIPGLFRFAKGNKDIPEQKKQRLPFRYVYPFAHVIFDFLRRKGHEDLFGNPDTIRKVTIAENGRDPVEEYSCRIISLIYFLLVGSCAVLAIALVMYENPLINGRFLKRAATGEGSTSYELAVESGAEPINITVDVSEKRCPPEKLEEYFEQAYEIVKSEVKGDNSSLDEISTGLNLITHVEGYSIQVMWENMDYTYIYPDGDIRTENVEAPVILYLNARLKYFEEERLYSFPVRLVPVKKSATEIFREKLAVLLTGADDRDSDDGMFELPVEVDGEAVTWRSTAGENIVLLALLGLLALFLLIPAFRADLRNREKERDEQMLRDYPEIICKFVMLLSAGMTCKSAWSKICSDYRTKKDRRFAYEEMLITEKQMSFSIAENAAYEQFATRCAIRSYQRFGSLLARNIKRGSRDIIRLLEEEADESLSVRKEVIRTGIEEAGTKLLLPMGGMLCIVIAVILVPAFSSFGF